MSAFNLEGRNRILTTKGAEDRPLGRVRAYNVWAVSASRTEAAMDSVGD